QASAQDDAALARSRRHALMTTLAQFRLGRLDEAEAALAEAPGDLEAALWAAALAAERRQYAKAAAGFRRAGDLLNDYPAQLQALLRPLRARTALATRDLPTAKREIAALWRLSGAAKPVEIELLEALLAEQRDEKELAFASYQKLRDGPDRAVAAEAGLRGAGLGSALSLLSGEEALRQIETVAATWRGDPRLEPDALHALGQRYAEAGRWRDMFAA